MWCLAALNAASGRIAILAPPVSSVKLPHGTTATSQASSRNGPFTRFFWLGKQDSCVFTPTYPTGPRARTWPRRLGSSIQDGCEIRPRGPNRCWEVGGGRTTRQPGQVRKEAALTRPGGSLSSLPLLALPRRGFVRQAGGAAGIGAAPIKSLA